MPTLTVAFPILFLLACLASPAFAADPTLHVFILAGQSNMEGQGVVDYDHPEHYNGGRGNLEKVMADPAKAALFTHVKDDSGEWVVRDDVAVRFRIRSGVLKGGLTVGFTGYGGPHHFGPEFQFGHVVGEHFDQPVLLIKTAWGGKSLYKDFRPPGSGGETGEFYTQMLAEIREALDNIATDFPQYADHEPVLSGFVWFQGWNDAFNDEARAQYADNLANLVKDVRKALNSPALPVVIGETGNMADKAGDVIKSIRQSQAAAALLPEFEGNVAFVETTAFARPAEDSPNTTHGHHWFGNAESYFLIGDAMGKAMLQLIGDGAAD